VKGSGVDEAEEDGERREGKTATAAARETETGARQRNDTRQAEVCNILMHFAIKQHRVPFM